MNNAESEQFREIIRDEFGEEIPAPACQCQWCVKNGQR